MLTHLPYTWQIHNSVMTPKNWTGVIVNVQ
jgi:hypothetical protein